MRRVSSVAICADFAERPPCCAHVLLDLGAAAREVTADVLVDAADLRDAVFDRRPLDAEALTQLSSKGRLVQEAGGAGVGVERAPVQGGRAAGGDRAVGHHRVRVQLRIARA